MQTEINRNNEQWINNSISDDPEIKVKHNSTKGMTVQELIDRLEKIENKTQFVACPEIGFGGISGVLDVSEIEVKGYAGTYSFQRTRIVLLTN